MRKIFAAVFGLLFFISSTCYAYAPEGRLIVTMLNVGQGDSFLIETPTQNVLIDTGDLKEREQLLAELEKAGVTRFERIILTHPHIDHIGGVRAVNPKSRKSNPNNESIVGRLSFGDGFMLFTGDIEKKVEEEYYTGEIITVTRLD